MVKKKYFVLLVTLLLVFVLGCCTTSLGYTIDDFIAYTYQIRDLNINANFNYHTNLVITYQNNLKNALANTNYTGFVLTSANNNNGYVQIVLYNTVVSVGTVNNTDIQNLNPNVAPAYLTINQYNGSVSLKGTLRQTSYFASSCYGLIENNNVTDWKQNRINQYSPTPSTLFEPSYDDLVAYNGFTDVCAKQVSYNVGGQWKIGSVTDTSELHSFAFYLYNGGYELGYIFGNSNHTVNGANALYWDSNNVFVNNRLINYKTLYKLDFYKYYEDDPGTAVVETYYFIFLPINSVISNGVITDFGSGDFTTQDSTNAILDNSQTQTILDNLSGEDYAQKFGYKTYTTTFSTFIFDMFDSLRVNLLGERDVTFTFPYMKTYITVNSSQFTTPDGLIKGFVSTFLTFGFFVLIYQHINAWYHKVEEGNAEAVLTYSDVDDETFLM